MTKSWTVPVEEDGDEYVITLPPEMLEETGWKEGDVLEWITGDNGYELRKVNE